MHAGPDATDPFDLARFVEAQERDYRTALAELRAGRKRTHWIWYVLPQMRGLGTSGMSRHFGLASLDEARAYLAHPVLGPRLAECVRAIDEHKAKGAVAILGPVDAAKFRSCLTLFQRAAGPQSVFERALRDFFEGVEDARTCELLGPPPDRPAVVGPAPPAACESAPQKPPPRRRGDTEVH